jgi:hypothetical protein
MAPPSIAAHILAFPPQIQPALEAEGIVQLTRTLAYQLHGVAFDRLLVEERHEIVDAAVAAWHTVQDVLAGKAAHIPQWERQCLTFSGPYDPAWLQPQTGQVQ